MSHMAREAAEAPEAVARFLQRNGKALTEIGAHLRRRPPPVIITSACDLCDSDGETVTRSICDVLSAARVGVEVLNCPGGVGNGDGCLVPVCGVRCTLKFFLQSSSLFLGVT